MNADFFFKFTKFKFGSLVNAEDFADKINYQWTGSFLIIATAVIAMRQYIFTPIQCWVPPEWPRPWEEYTENYCWIQNTYFVEFKSVGFPDTETRKRQELNYYQWVPFVLALQALLVYVPHMLWKILTMQSGYNPNSMVKLASETAISGNADGDKKKKSIVYLAEQITKAMKHRKQWRGENSLRMRVPNLCMQILPCFWFGKRSGTMLFSLYIANKLVYLTIGVLHLYLMQLFLGFQSLAFGWDCLVNLLRGRQWEETNVFPRVTFCDVPSKRIGQWNVRSVQCVLPVNLLNEKIYIFLWFWTVVCLCLTVISTMLWIVRMLVLKNRQNFIKKYLRVLDPVLEGENREMRKRFVNEFLAYDGIFLLRMIAVNIGDLCAAEVVEQMFKMYASPPQADQPQRGRRQSNASPRKPASAANLDGEIPLLPKSSV